MKKQDMLYTWLAATVGFALLAAMLLKTFLQRLILPRLDATSLIALSLVALVLDHYLSKHSRRDYRFIPLLAAVIFGLFPFAACFLGGFEAIKIGMMGAVIFTAATFLFDSMNDRLSSGPAAKFAPLISAFGLYLATHCLEGII